MEGEVGGRIIEGDIDRPRHSPPDAEKDGVVKLREYHCLSEVSPFSYPPPPFLLQCWRPVSWPTCPSGCAPPRCTHPVRIEQLLTDLKVCRC